MICPACIKAADTFMPHIGCEIGCPCRHRSLCGDRHVCPEGDPTHFGRPTDVFLCNRPKHPDSKHFSMDVSEAITHHWEAP